MVILGTPEPICQVGQDKPCGQPAMFMIAVTGIRRPAWSSEVHEGGIVFLCAMHARVPIARWDTDITPERTS